ncbi:MAG: zeta toxin family protein [Methylibium sp.]|uniref:zeta toxin family protein n=1 Tax=Methylibium sp. TaxID=2067992 RepID=UPI0017EC047F|nr:zeta toxin family protein [Methylibium sp.]MBA3596356.1 zeta toxin family protein [Methylibium sp.]
MARKAPTARLYVLSGVNGAGKSSIAGAAFRSFGGEYYNPDEAARALLSASHRLSQEQANGVAWQQGKRLLERAIAGRLDFALETTLGANTIPRLLAQAASEGIEVRVWYAGLASPELHIERVRSRVRGGGHDIAEADIRRRFEHSRLNLIQLLPALTALRMYDNSAAADPAAGMTPSPLELLHMERARIIGPPDLSLTPEWAKPIVAAALKIHQAGRKLS